MSEESPTPVPAAASTHTVVIVRRPLWQTIAKWIAIVVVGLLLLVAAVMFGINTQPGRRFVADRIAGYTMANGLNFRVGRIDGSIYGDMILRDVRVQDQRGTFLTSPELRVDWRPFAFASSHVDVRSLTSPLVSMSRLPELKVVPSEPDAPLLPDLDIDVNRFAIERIDLAPAVSGTRRLARVNGTAHIADRRAQVTLDGMTLNGPGIAGGDRVALKLDAVPDDDKFDLDLKLNAPTNGLVAGLATLEAPLTLDVSGQGSWRNWSGRAVSTLGGGALANLNIQGRDGNFKVRGTTQPGLYLKGPVERLTAPRLDVAIDAALADRIVDTKMLLRSSALQVTGDGKIDLARSRFSNFKTTAMLLTPGAIAPNLRGRSVNIALALDGAFATPLVDYKLTADAIGFGETTVEGLYAEGKARIDADRVMVPIAARARRVTGLNAAAGGLLTNVSVNGDLAINNGTEILSDNLRIRSDRIDATAIVAANLSTGRYAGALKGRVNDYQVEGFGIVNLTTDAELYTVPSGGFGIRGRVVAQTSRIFNDGAREFLGGNAIARVNLDYSPQGIINFSNLRVTAPQFRITSGSGRYDPAGPLLVNADGYSTVYGPVSARVTGTLFAPVATIRAARPGLGVGLAGVTATIRGQGTRYAIVATGGSDYGPFSADLLLSTGPTLTADIRRARFAGIDFNGRVQQTSAGPFAGRLAFNGSGVNGTLNLAAQGAYQRADVNARALNAVIPGTAGLTIGRAIIVGTAVLYDQPAITGDAQVANLKMGDFVLRTARARIDYRGGSGTAQALAEGSSGVPFRVVANARFSPKLWLAALQGTANGINFKTASPARIVPDRGTYRLQPTRIDFDQGSLRLAGTYGSGITLQSRLDRLNLSIANAFVPGLGLGGTATGSLDFAQPTGASFPTADAKLRIANFTRSSLASVSTPVNIVFAGRLQPSGGDARAIVQRGTTTIGRMVATLSPLPPGAGSWMTRLSAAPLSGGIRYNGPAGVLFSLGGLSGQQLSGPIAVAADFGGRVSAPRLNGIVRASNLTYDNELYGTRLSAMRINGRFTNDRFELVEMNARAGDGTVTATGTVGLASDSGFPIDIRATLNDARLARSDALGATATGTIRVTNSAANGGLIEGELIIPEARYEIIRQGAAEVPELTGVRRKSDAARAAANPNAARAGPPGLFRLALRVRADNRLFVSGMGLESEWLADLRIGGTSAAPNVTGQARLVRGTYSFSGKRFDVTRGIVRFEGGPIGNPSLDIAASTTAEGISATIGITGNALDPRLTFTSTPALPQDEVLSRLLFGSSVTNLSATQAIQLASALNGLRGSGGGLNPLGKLRSVTGIDRLRILGADEATGRGTAIAAGQYLTDDIYIEIITDSKGFTATQLEIALSKALSLLSSTGSFGGSNASLRYSKDY